MGDDMALVSREQAISRGLKRYFTGESCKCGHVLERLTSNRACVACGAKRKIAWAASKAKMLASRARARRSANPEKFRGYDRQRYKSDPRMKMLSAAKKRAKLKGIPFNIAMDDIEIPATCPLLGIPLIIGNGVMGDNSPTLDRIVNEAGYVRGNVVIVSYAANRCKGSLRSDDISRLAIKLRDLEKLAQDKGFI